MSRTAQRSFADMRGAPPRVAAGDFVCTGNNAHPLYSVIALSPDRAWIRDVQNGADHVVPLERCRSIAAHGA